MAGAKLPGQKKPGGRLHIALACAECGSRNFKTTRSPTQVGLIELKKFCPSCGHHTRHIESK